MNIDEVTELLELATIYDNRNAGKADIVAWGMALKDVPHGDAMAAVVEHYTKNPDRRAMPGDIWAACRRMVRERFAQTPTPLPPPELADNPAAENAWKRAREAEIAAGTYVAPPPQELKPRPFRELGSTFRTPDDVEPVTGEDDEPTEEDGPEEAAA